MAPACLLVKQASARNFSDSPKKPVALFGVDRFELAAVNSDEFTREEVELFAQHRELPANLAQRLQVVLPEVRNRLGIWSQLL